MLNSLAHYNSIIEAIHVYTCTRCIHVLAVHPSVCLLCCVRQEVGDWATKDAAHAGPLVPAHFADLHYLSVVRGHVWTVVGRELQIV